MDDLTSYISLEETPIIIVKKLDFLREDAVEQEQERILQYIEAWRSSWESAEIEWYREFYSHQFLSNDRTYDEWVDYKQLIFPNYSWIKIALSDFQILKFDDYYLVEFHQNFQLDIYTDSGKKKLYINNDGENLTIISELWDAGGAGIN